MIYLTESEVEPLLAMPAAIDAVRTAFRKLALDEAESPPRLRCRTDKAMLHLLPASLRTLGGLGFKAYTVAAGRARFHVVLYDAKTGELDAVLEGDALGQFRTGAASGVATDLLARPDASNMGLYGTGKQARTQLLAVAAVRPLTRVTVVGRDPNKLRDFCARMSAEANVEVVPAPTPEAAARDQDIISTATTSRDPVLRGAWVAPGSHVNLVGSNFLAKAETDAELFAKASVVVADSVDQARLEAGDFVAALQTGVLNWSSVGELSRLVVGNHPGRSGDTDITVFKSLGIGAEDVALAQVVVAEARRRGVGQQWGTNQ